MAIAEQNSTIMDLNMDEIKMVSGACYCICNNGSEPGYGYGYNSCVFACIPSGVRSCD